MARKQSRKRQQADTATRVESAHRRVRRATPAIGEGGDAAAHSTACGYVTGFSECITMRDAAEECTHLRVHQAASATQEAGVGGAAHEAACMDLTPQRQSLIPTASHSLQLMQGDNPHPMEAAQEEGPAHSAIVLPPVGEAAKLQAGVLAPAINANAMPPAPPVQHHDAVLAGALNLAADQDVIHQLISLPQVPAALDPVEFEPGFIGWKYVNMRDNTLHRESTQEVLEFLSEDGL